MKKTTIAMDNDGNITTDYDGFPGDACYEEGDALVAILKQFGIEMEIHSVRPKRDAKVVSSETQTVHRG